MINNSNLVAIIWADSNRLITIIFADQVITMNSEYNWFVIILTKSVSSSGDADDADAPADNDTDNVGSGLPSLFCC